MKIAYTLSALLLSLSSLCGQGTIHVTFDGPPELPSGSSGAVSYYSESGISVTALGNTFTRRWSGASLFPDNDSTYLQPGGSGEFFYTYLGATRRFDAVSVDLALYSSSSLDAVVVEFVASGYTRGIDIIATTEFTVTGAVDGQGRPVFQTFYFPPEFRGMYYLSVMPTAPLWSLDNLVVYIPEPSAWALLVTGGGLLWAWRLNGENLWRFGNGRRRMADGK